MDRLVFETRDVEAAKAKLVELMDAQTIVRGTERGEDGRCKYVEIPNHPVQLAAAVKILEYQLGKPTQMVVVDQRAGQAPARADLGRMLVANPQLVTQVLATMREALESTQAITVQGVTSDPSARAPDSISAGSAG